jgi:hypothetical protein
VDVYSFSFELTGTEDWRDDEFQDSFQERGMALPWKSRLAIAELSIQDRDEIMFPDSFNASTANQSPSHSTIPTHKSFQMFFSDATQVGGRWKWTWEDSVSIKRDNVQIVQVKISLIDPVQVAHALKASGSEFIVQPFAKPLNFYPYYPDGENDVAFVFPSQAPEGSNVSTVYSPKLYANQTLLMAKSEYFQSLFERFESRIVNGKKVVEVKDFPESVIYGMLQYIYTGDISKSTQSDSYPLLHQAALFYGIEYMDMYTLVELIRHQWESQGPLKISELIEQQPVKAELEKMMSIAHSAGEWKNVASAQRCNLQMRLFVDKMLRIADKVGKGLTPVAFGLLLYSGLGPLAFVLYVYVASCMFLSVFAVRCWE